MRHAGLLLASAIMTGLGATQPAIAAVAVTDDVALYWNQVAAQNLLGSPVTTSRGIAMVGVAIREAVNASLGNPAPSYLHLAPAAGADTRAAASVAARNLLVALNPANTATYDAALTASLALVPDGQSKLDGMLAGNTVANAMIMRRTGDGSTAVVNYTPSGLIGRWAPTPPGNLPAAAPQWGGVTPWLMNSGDQFRPGAPPTLDSAAYTAAFNEVKAIGDLNSVTRTPDQLAAAQFWATPGAAGVQPWVLTAVDLAQSRGFSTLKNAGLLALVETAVADSVIGIFDAKYEFDYWRPVTAIRMADADGNPDTAADAGWTPAITTPNHPSFISGHSAVAGSATGVLADFFGDDNAFCINSGMLQRCFTSLSGSAEDAANSRLWGGIHWRFDNEAGLALGRSIAAFELDRAFFNSVPEPANWALMIAGFGLAGATLRRRVRRVAYA